MKTSVATGSFRQRLLIGFGAGFLATLIFHQLTLVVLAAANIAPFGPFNMTPTSPFGIPAVFSLAFWGGLWGVLFAAIDRHFPAGAGYWVVAFLFGAIVTSAVALLIVAPLKGHPVGGGWAPALLLTVFLINGAWGIGTGVFLKLASALSRQGR